MKGATELALTNWPRSDSMTYRILMQVRPNFHCQRTALSPLTFVALSMRPSSVCCCFRLLYRISVQSTVRCSRPRSHIIIIINNHAVIIIVINDDVDAVTGNTQSSIGERSPSYRRRTREFSSTCDSGTARPWDVMANQETSPLIHVIINRYDM